MPEARGNLHFAFCILPFAFRNLTKDLSTNTQSCLI